MNFIIIWSVWILIGNSLVESYDEQLAERSFVKVQIWNDMKQNSIPVLRVGYQYLFGKNYSNSYFAVLKEVYGKIKENTDVVKAKIIDKLEEAEKDASVYNITEMTKTKTFDEAIVYVYSTLDLYYNLNRDLRLKNESTEFASFALVLNSILFNWCFLELASTTTYRAVRFDKNYTALYEVGKEYVWLPFTSSTLSETKAREFKEEKNNVIFVFDNSDGGFWRPRKIYEIAYDPPLKEAVFPSGAMFRVTAVNKTTYTEYTYIYVKLLSQGDENECDAIGLIPCLNIVLLEISVIISMIYI